ncbi:MAG: signal peptidase II [bacterium]
MRIKKSTWLFYLVSFLLVAFDQVTKIFIKGFSIFGFTKQGFQIGESYNLLGDFVKLTYVENAGMAFGISFGPAKIILSLFSVTATFFLAYYLHKAAGYSKYLKLGVAIILAGALGNLIDRVFYGVIYGEAPLFYGKVVDYMQIDIPDINIFGLYYTHWPVFNVADSCITIGVIILLLFNKHIPSFSQVFGKSNKQIDEA